MKSVLHIINFYPNFKSVRLELLVSICFMPFPDMIFISHLITYVEYGNDCISSWSLPVHDYYFNTEEQVEICCMS